MSTRTATLACVGLAILLRAALWWRGPAGLDALTLIDDSYLVLHLARSIAGGLGPFYGLAPTNGFQPLYTFALVPSFWLWPHDPDMPIRASIALGLLFDLATLLALLALVRRTTRGRVAVPATALIWAVNPYVLRNAANGMETSLAALMLVVLLFVLDRWRRRAPGIRDGFVFGVLLGVAILARLDLVLIWPVALAVAWRAHGLRHTGRAIAVAGVATCAAGVVCAPWLAYSWHWTGTLLQVSGQAVRYMDLGNVDHAPTWSGFFRPMLEIAAATLVRSNGVLLLGTALGMALALHRTPRGSRAARDAFAPVLPAIGFAFLLFVAYTFYVFGHWFFMRYLFPVAIPATWVFALSIDALETGAAGPPRRPRRALPAFVALAVSVGMCLTPPFMRLWGPLPVGHGYRPIGEWAAKSFPPGTLVGGSQTGALGYFAKELVIVNLDGVVNRGALEAMRAGRAIPYLRGHGIRWLLWQDDIDWLLRETKGAPSDDIALVRPIEGVRSLGEPWFLYEVTGVPGQADVSMTPPGAGPSAASE